MTAATSKPATAAPLGWIGNLRGVIATQEGVLTLVLLALVMGVGLANNRFLEQRNVSVILSNSSYIAVAAIGMSMVIISGNIDVSVESLIGVVATVAGTLAVNGAPIWVAWTVPVLVGILIEAINGFFVAYLRIPAIVVTLGMMSILKGGLILATEGKWIYGLPEGFALSQLSPLGIPMPVYFMVILTILAALWMRYTQAGRAIYAIGGNKEAARLSGISERRVIMQVFIVNGLTAGIAGVLYGTQFTAIQSTVPVGLLLFIISASVVGGVSILGGSGTVIGATIAAILLKAIDSGMVFMSISAYWLEAVQGLLILVTVLADILRRRRQVVKI